MSRSINLRPAELKQLKLLAEGLEISSPLVLLLCPSVLAKAVKGKATLVDRATLARLAEKLDAKNAPSERSAPIQPD